MIKCTLAKILFVTLIILFISLNQVFGCGSLVGSLDSLNPNDIKTNGSYLYATTTHNGFYVVDISNPTKPNVAGSVDVPGTSLQPIDISGNYAFTGGTSGRLYIINISNPQEPVIVSSIETGDPDDSYDYLKDVFIQGNYAYVTQRHSGFHIVDISNIEDPQLKGSLSMSSDTWNLIVSGSYAYVRTTTETHVVDISNPLNPVLRGNFAGGGPKDMQILWPYLYSANGDLQVVDISDPDSPEIVGEAETPKIAVDLTIVGSYAYIADGNSLGGSISLIDVTDPLNPEYVCSFSVTQDVWKITYSSSYFYIAGYGLKVLQFPALSDGFDYPVGKPDGEGYSPSGWDFLEWTTEGVWHPGEDWNGDSGGDTDLGDPVYAVSSGLIVAADNYGPGWGNIILIEHTLLNGRKVWSQYAHLDTIIRNSGYVVKGEQLGTIGKGHQNEYLAHLHFEIRREYRAPDAWVKGLSKCDVMSSYYRPSKFIDHNRISPGVNPAPEINANCSDEPVSIESTEILSITVALDRGIYPGYRADWWCVADTPFGWYYYDLNEWRPGQLVTHQGGLYNLEPHEVLNTTGLQTGNYVFYFGVDGYVDGEINNPLYYDSVEVNIVP